jgi:hypothetical protein
MSVFSMHFHKVLNNHVPVDDTVLELIPEKAVEVNAVIFEAGSFEQERLAATAKVARVEAEHFK